MKGWIGGLAIAIAAAALAGCGKDEAPSEVVAVDEIPYPEYRTAMNLAAGLMNRFEFKEAEEAYLQIMEAWSASRDARRNHAIAILNQSEPGAQERAIELLDAISEAWFEQGARKGPRDLSSQYAKALALLYLGQSREARDLFIECANRAPTDAYAAFFAGQCLELEGRFEEALGWYERSIELDDYLRSPLLGAQRCLARLGRDADGEAMLARFIALADNPRGKLAEFKYTRMGTLGEVRAARDLDLAAKPPTGPLFADATPMPIAGLLPGASVNVRPAADLNRDGVLDFAVVSTRSGERPVESLAISGTSDDGSTTWAMVPFATGPSIAEQDPGFGLAPATLFWADFDNDGRTDVAVSPADGSAPFWWRQREGVRWSREWLDSSRPNESGAERSDAGEVPSSETREHGDGRNSSPAERRDAGDVPSSETPERGDGRNSSPAERRDAGEVPSEARRRGRTDTEGLNLLAAADFDHDGDVDLIASDAAGTRFILNRRDGDTDRATTWIHRPLAESLPNATSAALGDFDGDGDLDVMLLAENGPAQIWINDLLWSWRRDARFASIEATNPVEAVWFRDDDSGEPMLATLAGDADARELAIWSLDGESPQPLEIASEAAAIPGAFSLAAIDLAGSGRTNLLVSRPLGDGSIRLEVRDARGNLIESVGPLPATASLAVPDARGAVMLLGDDGAGSPQWRDAGPGRMPFAAIWFSGRTDPSQQMRTNESGLGTRGDARTVGSWQSRTALPWRGGSLGQPLEPVLFGLGGAPRIEWLSIDWPDGVLQSELDLGAGVHSVVETQRQISSCPVIFAWNGERFEFITDTLGVGGMGYLAAIEEKPDGTLVPIYPTPRPLESVLLGGDGVIAPRDGRYEIRLGEPMEEACYLDAARLVAWDLPAGWSMTLDERMGIAGPAPTGEPRFHRRSMTPDSATMAIDATSLDVISLDVTEAIAHADFLAADPGEADPRFIGRTAKPWTLTLRFPRPIAEGDGDPALVVDGWVEYPYSSTSFAMWQAGATPEPPTFEALDPATGDWVVLVEQYGYPAGMPRQASFALDRAALPEGCTTLRLRSTSEVYLDRAMIAWFEPCPQAVRRAMPLAEASVADTGFAFRPHLPQRRPYYDYDRRAPLWDVKFQFGFYTAFGLCTELLEATDDAVAIFGAGEEIRLEFAAVAPPVEASWSRAWVLELDGWCKDMDPFTGLGAALEPLPLRDGFESTPRREALHRRFNTRYAGGR